MEIHIVLNSTFYGIIPYELIDTFPMGQSESISSYNENDLIYNKSLKRSTLFLNLFSKNYEKCGILIPEQFLNQFGEIEPFPKNNPIYQLEKVLQKFTKLNYSVFKDLDSILEFFINNDK